MTAGAPRARWAILGVCVLGTVQAYIHRLGFAPLVPTFVADLGLSYAAAGTLMASYFWPYIAVQLPMGAITDRLGARRTMLASLAVLGIGIVLFVSSRGYAASLAARVVVGLGSAGFWLPGLRLIQDWFPVAERGRATGISSAGGGIGGTAVLLVMPLFADALGWRWGYAMSLVPWIAMVLLTVWLVRSRPRADGGHGRAADPLLHGFLAATRTRGVRPLCLMAFTSYGAFLGLVTWLPAFLVSHERFTPADAGLVTALVTAGTTVSWPLAGLVSDRIGRRRPVYFVSQALGAAGCLGFAWIVPGAGFAASLAVAAFTGLALGGMVLPFVMLLDLVPPARVGLASGLVNTCWLLGGMVAPAALGRLVDASGSFVAAFGACALLALLALPIAWLVPEAAPPSA